MQAGLRRSYAFCGCFWSLTLAVLHISPTHKLSVGLWFFHRFERKYSCFVLESASKAQWLLGEQQQNGQDVSWCGLLHNVYCFRALWLLHEQYVTWFRLPNPSILEQPVLRLLNRDRNSSVLKVCVFPVFLITCLYFTRIFTSSESCFCM